MSFGDSISYCLSNYFKFDGRGCRSEYWWFVLAIFLAGIVAQVIDSFIGHPIVGVLVSLGTIIPNIAAAARRLHDTDRSGWWQLLGFIPLIGWIVLLIFLIQPGGPGRNRFGDNPLGA